MLAFALASTMFPKMVSGRRSIRTFVLKVVIGSTDEAFHNLPVLTGRVLASTHALTIEVGESFGDIFRFGIEKCARTFTVLAFSFGLAFAFPEEICTLLDESSDFPDWLACETPETALGKALLVE